MTTTTDSSITQAPTAEKAPSRMTSRKFLLVLATLVAASTLLAFGYIEPVVWRDVVIATVCAYITGNVTQRVMTKDPAA